MRRTLFCVVASVMLFAAAVPAQQAGGYFDVLTVKVKPEKRMEFDAICKKFVEANRQHGGDLWIAAEVAYGESNTVYFTTPRTSIGEIEKGMERFMGAMAKAHGPDGMTKVFADLSSCVESMRSEIRRRRPDLSANMPSDPAALESMVAQARWIRTTILRVRPGHTPRLEEQMKASVDARTKADPKIVTGVSQSVAGADGTVYYVTTFRTSLAGFDNEPPLPQVLGATAYEKLRTVVADGVESIDVVISRFLPELSNPPQTFLTASPDFWTPKPSALAKTEQNSKKEEKK
jgi:hypothetical protein